VTEPDPGGINTTAPPLESDGVDTTEALARPDAGERPPKSSARGRKASRTIIEWTILIGSALVIAIVIKTFLFQAFYIPSESMKPALNVGDRVLVNKLSYSLHDVHRGDIVVFTTPPKAKDADGKIKDLVKRVIALPDETLQTHSGHVYINGRALQEPYLKSGVQTCAPNSGASCVDLPPMKIPAGDVFVMGDNRTASKDSRYFDAIKESSIVGRVFVRIWPLTDLGFL